jgi:uncharacterized phage protein (TIGR01671 family)
MQNQEKETISANGRELKFRAWNKHSMLYSETYATLSRFFQKLDCIEDENYILMQYTGLKDKNGKEIYEGDICREIFQGEYVGEVMFTPTQGYLVANRPIWPHDIEVIGNIWEHPDLLEVK